MFKDNSHKRLLEVVQKLDARDKSKINENLGGDETIPQQIQDSEYNFNDDTSSFNSPTKYDENESVIDFVDENSGIVASYIKDNNEYFPVDLVSLYFINPQKALKLGFNKIDSFEANNRSQWLGMSMNEDISIDVEVGDTIMMGRFKNKSTVVKSIGKDEHGMPTINGKKVVTFRKATKNKK
jgi:hypothetical protein